MVIRLIEVQVDETGFLPSGHETAIPTARTVKSLEQRSSPKMFGFAFHRSANRFNVMTERHDG